MDTTQDTESIQLGAKMYTLFTKGEIILTSVPTNRLGDIVRAAKVFGNSVEYVKFTGKTRNNDIVFCNLKPVQIFVQQSTTARREFFKVMLDNSIEECSPDNGVFDELKIIFK